MSPSQAIPMLVRIANGETAAAMEPSMCVHRYRTRSLACSEGGRKRGRGTRDSKRLRVRTRRPEELSAFRGRRGDRLRV
jgi:hypothetical protein